MDNILNKNCEEHTENCSDCSKCAFNIAIKVAYHCALKQNVESILQNGLIKKPNFIYLSTMPKNGFGDVTLEIDIVGLNLCALSDWELVSLENISKERIKIYKS